LLPLRKEGFERHKKWQEDRDFMAIKKLNSGIRECIIILRIENIEESYIFVK